MSAKRFHVPGSRAFAAVFVVAAVALPLTPSNAAPSRTQLTTAGSGDISRMAPTDAIAPRDASYGRFADTYTKNTSDFMTPDTNPAIGTLSRMLDLWTPGTSWDNGTVVNKLVHDRNIEIVEEITAKRTDAEAEWAYVIDRRHQSYTMTEGLGSDADRFRMLTHAGTTVTGVPDYAYERSQSDEGNSNGKWADIDSPLGSAIELVDTVRGPSATSNRAKEYYQYMRPFRWSDQVSVAPGLVARIKPESEADSDGGFPSGHTNAAYLAGLGLAASTPEHYSELMMTAAKAGHSRVVAGMHSPLDVIGGRILATGIAAATLADPANAELVERARNDVMEQLEPTASANVDRAEYQADLERYEDLTTYDLPKVGESGLPAHVPAGAEALLRTRYPYMTDDEIRWVLLSTTTDSGLPVVDDAEGWGRLNMFAAANGYGEFARDVAVNLDGAAGFQAQDIWRNDIGGDGGLTKLGKGTLTLAGANTFAGGVLVEGGTVVATQATSFGTGDVELLSGTLQDDSDSTIRVENDFALHDDATLDLGLEDREAGALNVMGKAALDGDLTIDVSEVEELDGARLIAHSGSTGRFDDLAIEGAEEGAFVLDYRADGVYLVASKPADDKNTVNPEPKPKPGLPKTGVSNR